MMKAEFVEDILSRLRQVLPGNSRPIGLHEPTLAGNESTYVNACLDSGWVSSAGNFVKRFEIALAEYTGVKHVVAVASGTAALHVCLRLAGVQPGDEVLVPSLTFIATANAVSYCGAIPHFVECSEETLGVDARKLEAYLHDVSVLTNNGCFHRRTGRRIRVMVPMHAFGCPVDLEPLVDLCDRYQITLVEDAAESLGSYYKGRHTGNWGTLAALSFNGNKIVTTGGGGAILTNDTRLAEMARHLTTVAKVPHPWEFNHDEIGYNYRMPNLNAALGVAQLEQLPAFLNNKRQLSERYRAAFEGSSVIRYFEEPSFAKSNYWLNTLILKNNWSDRLNDLLTATNHEGIMTRPCWTPVHRQVMYASCPHMDLSVTENLASRIINIPSSAFLGGSHG